MTGAVLQIIYLADTRTCGGRNEKNAFTSEKEYEFMAVTCGTYMLSAVSSCGLGARRIVSQ
jgi:hypothetical protein